MKIFPIDHIDFSFIVADLRAGKTVVYPTETCYGLGCDATNAHAVQKIYAIKGRSETKPLIVVVDKLDRMAPYIGVTAQLKQIEKKYWPGALTVVVSAKPDGGLAPGVVSTDGTVAFRVTSNAFARTLVAALGLPLVSTSANLADEPNIYSADVVEAIFSGRDVQPDIVIDAGVLPITPPSTVVRLVGNHMEVIRQGGVHIDVFK